MPSGMINDGQSTPTPGKTPSLTSPNNFINFCATLTGKSASCLNPVPMGIIAAVTNMPSAKFVFPKNGATLQANTNFTIAIAVQHLETGWFGGVLTAEVVDGLPKGAYRLASINAAANHQPLLVATAQRGALDDMI
ncbi:hypothetical protein LXA43DRAFT_968790 [Ganoderma leucocontextum]|nr:hypothetical protein LXA43DRAFT_968790 [Ganoderma leucocontextum]